MVTWPGRSVLASNGGTFFHANLDNYKWSERCFSVRRAFLQLAMVNIQIISADLSTTCTLSIHVKIIAKMLVLGCRIGLRRRWCTLKMTRQICRVSDFGCLSWSEYSLYPVMVCINKICSNLPIYWYQYWYVCTIWLKYGWRHIKVNLTSYFETAVGKNYGAEPYPLRKALSKKPEKCKIIETRYCFKIQSLLIRLENKTLPYLLK